MSQFADKRELLIFGDADNNQIQQQLNLLQKSEIDVKERDISIVHIEKGNPYYEIYKIDSNAAITVLLFGKDKSIKYRSQQVVSTEKLFGIIDAMPMRQAEMQRKENSKK